MKCMDTVIVTAAMVLAVTAANSQMTVTVGDGGKTVIETVTTPTYGTVTLTWPSDANIAGGLWPDSPYWVPGINPDGLMPLSVANAFVAKLNENAYQGITTWSLPITVYDDTKCTLISPDTGGGFGYDCGLAADHNAGYPYSELGNLFYNVMAGRHTTISWRCMARTTNFSIMCSRISTGRRRDRQTR